MREQERSSRLLKFTQLRYTDNEIDDEDGEGIGDDDLNQLGIQAVSVDTYSRQILAEGEVQVPEKSKFSEKSKDHEKSKNSEKSKFPERELEASMLPAPGGSREPERSQVEIHSFLNCLPIDLYLSNYIYLYPFL